jgi:hypothetical protein
VLKEADPARRCGVYRREEVAALSQAESKSNVLGTTQCRMYATGRNSQNHRPCDAACRHTFYTLMVSLTTLRPSGANRWLRGGRSIPQTGTSHPSRTAKSSATMTSIAAVPTPRTASSTASGCFARRMSRPIIGQTHRGGRFSASGPRCRQLRAEVARSPFTLTELCVE